MSPVCSSTSMVDGLWSSVVYSYRPSSENFIITFEHLPDDVPADHCSKELPSETGTELYRLQVFMVPQRDCNSRTVSAGETGLLVVKITRVAPFLGYAGNREQTEKKKLRDVFQQGDVYFNSGDLMRIDQEGFIYFQDRVGDTFRWKGENVATTEVTDVLVMLDFIEEANVYGVEVPGHEGRIGMAALTLKENRHFDCTEMFNHVTNFLPVYARPRFIRILESMELTGTFKQMKVKLVKEGFDPEVVPQPLYVLQESSRSYTPLTRSYYSSIRAGEIRF